MQKIEQEIFLFDYKKILKIIINIITNKYNDTYNIFYPKKKNWFEYYINTIKNFNKKVLNTMTYYKSIGYKDLNNVLFNNSFSLIYYFNRYDTNIFNKTLINSDPLYIFPNDL
jgi:hypothetical protein